MNSLEEKLSALGLSLPEPPEAKGNYLPYVVSGNLVYLSGTLPIADGQVVYSGKVGQDQTIETAYEAAKLCVLNALANLKSPSGNFAQLARIVHVAGYVNGVDGFAESPKVINGASDLLAEILGDQGRHSRLAVSVNGLPLNATVETRLIAEIKGNQ